MNRYAIIRDVKNLPRERKIDLQNLVDECELIHDKTLSKHIDKVDLKRALICINERNYITGAAFFEEQNRVVYLDTLYILNSERKKGYGKQLLSVLKQYAKKKGFDKIELVVKRDNLIAIDLYKKKNFVIYRSVDENVISMVKYVDNSIFKLGKILFKILKEQDLEKTDFNDFHFESYDKNGELEGAENREIILTSLMILKEREKGVLTKEDYLNISRYANSESNNFSDKDISSGLKLVEGIDKEVLAKTMLVLSVYRDLKFQERFQEENKNLSFAK